MKVELIYVQLVALNTLANNVIDQLYRSLDVSAGRCNLPMKISHWCFVSTLNSVPGATDEIVIASVFFARFALLERCK